MELAQRDEKCAAPIRCSIHLHAAPRLHMYLQVVPAILQYSSTCLQGALFPVDLAVQHEEERSSTHSSPGRTDCACLTVRLRDVHGASASPLPMGLRAGDATNTRAAGHPRISPSTRKRHALLALPNVNATAMDVPRDINVTWETGTTNAHRSIGFGPSSRWLRLGRAAPHAHGNAGLLEPSTSQRGSLHVPAPLSRDGEGWRANSTHTRLVANASNRSRPAHAI